jgi:Domain of unknown function (DUF5658)
MGESLTFVGQPAATKVKAMLLGALALAQVGDVFTTNAVLELGGGEANPIMAWLQSSLGAGWVVPKLAATALLMFLLSRSKRPTHVAVIVALCATAPVWNLLLQRMR